MLPFLSEVAGYTSVPSNPSSYVNTHFTTSASFHSCTDHENTLPIQVTRSFNKLAVFRLESGRTKQLFSTFVSSLLSGHHCQAILVRPSLSRCCQAVVACQAGVFCQAVVSGHCRQAIVVRPSSLVTLSSQAIVIRPLLSGRRRHAVFVRPLSSVCRSSRRHWLGHRHVVRLLSSGSRC